MNNNISIQTQNMRNQDVLNSQQTLVLTEVDKLLLSTRLLLCNENNNTPTISTSNSNTNADNIIDNSSDSDEDKTTTRQKIKLTLQDVNLIFAMPFFCTIGTRLPFIYFVIELKSRYEMDMTSIAL